jgi:hypothetical protein
MNVPTIGTLVANGGLQTFGMSLGDTFGQQLDKGSKNTPQGQTTFCESPPCVIIRHLDGFGRVTGYDCSCPLNPGDPIPNVNTVGPTQDTDSSGGVDTGIQDPNQSSNQTNLSSQAALALAQVQWNIFSSQDTPPPNPIITNNQTPPFTGEIKLPSKGITTLGGYLNQLNRPYHPSDSTLGDDPKDTQRVKDEIAYFRNLETDAHLNDGNGRDSIAKQTYIANVEAWARIATAWVNYAENYEEVQSAELGNFGDELKKLIDGGKLESEIADETLEKVLEGTYSDVFPYADGFTAAVMTELLSSAESKILMGLLDQMLYDDFLSHFLFSYPTIGNQISYQFDYDKFNCFSRALVELGFDNVLVSLGDWMKESTPEANWQSDDIQVYEDMKGLYLPQLIQTVQTALTTYDKFGVCPA